MKKRLCIIWRCVFLATLLFLVGNDGLAQQVAADQTHKVDEFSGAGWESAMAHLDSFVVELQNNPNEVGVVMVYGGNHRRRGEAKAWSACIKDYLTKRRGIPANRLIMIDGGYRQTLTVELWRTADRKFLPSPSAQIKLKSVRFTKGKIGPWRKMCAL
jgi:hypothetical protein